MKGKHTKGHTNIIPAIRLADSAAPVAGILFTLAFAPFNHGYLAPLALMIAFVTWHKATLKQALLRGYLFGLGSFGLGVSWVFVSMHDFGGANSLISSLLTAVFIAFWSLFPALAAFISVKLTPNSNNLITLPSVWILMEYFRGQIVLDGFPWLLGAYSQLELPLSGYIPIVGVYGTGLLLALSASIGLAICFNNKRRLPLSLALVVVWGAGAVLQTINWTHAIGDPIRVSLIQGNISQDQKWQPDNLQKTLHLYKTMTEAHWESAIIVWPETAIPAYLSDVYDYFLLPLSQVAQAHHSDLVISVPARGQTEDEKYNAVITLGKKPGMYRKDHLLPFGEYLPWQPVSGFLLGQLNIRLGIFTPGGVNQPLLEAGGYPFITSICYEDAFGDAALHGLPDAAFLINVTNDGWFGDTIEPHQHLQIARMRALETGRFLLRSTNTGATAVVGPGGEIISQAPLFKTTVLTDFITPMGGITPYTKIGNKPIILITILLLIGPIIFRHRRTK